MACCLIGRRRRRAWLEGGVYPFLRMPQRQMERAEKLGEMKNAGGGGRKTTSGAAAGMDGDGLALG